MFVQNMAYLKTMTIKNVTGNGGNCQFAEVASRNIDGGIEVQNDHGEKIRISAQRVRDTMRLFLHTRQDIYGVHTEFAILLSDHVFIERIIRYMQVYYGNVNTNCSTFVEYVRTGVFCPCDPKRNYFAFTRGGNLYIGQKIKPGDVICIFYYQKFHGSHEMHEITRKDYRHMHRNKNDLTKLRARTSHNCSSEELLDLYNDCGFRDYHFMLCVATRNGEPVFIQQMGLHEPETGNERETASIAVSVGLFNTENHTPACMFISRSRMGAPRQQHYI